MRGDDLHFNLLGSIWSGIEWLVFLLSGWVVPSWNTCARGREKVHTESKEAKSTGQFATTMMLLDQKQGAPSI